MSGTRGFYRRNTDFVSKRHISRRTISRLSGHRAAEHDDEYMRARRNAAAFQRAMRRAHAAPCLSPPVRRPLSYHS